MTVRNNNSSRHNAILELCRACHVVLDRFVKWLNFQLEDDRLIGRKTQM